MRFANVQRAGEPFTCKIRKEGKSAMEILCEKLHCGSKWKFNHVGRYSSSTCYKRNLRHSVIMCHPGLFPAGMAPRILVAAFSTLAILFIFLSVAGYAAFGPEAAYPSSQDGVVEITACKFYICHDSELTCMRLICHFCDRYDRLNPWQEDFSMRWSPTCSCRCHAIRP